MALFKTLKMITIISTTIGMINGILRCTVDLSRHYGRHFVSHFAKWRLSINAH